MKKFLKKIVSLFCFFYVLPLYLFYRLESIFIKTNQPFCGMSQFLSSFPGLFGEYVRREFYKLALKKCSEDCCISFGTIFSHPQAEIGKGVYIGAYCTLGMVSLGDNVLLGNRVDILSGRKQHSFNDLYLPIKEQERIFEKITIGEDSWIGNGAIIMANIGKKCIVGAGSIVLEDVPDYSVVAGNPARIIKKRI